MIVCKEDPGLKVEPISWTAAAIEMAECDGVKGFAIYREACRDLGNVLTERDLPIEFFSHQLMECDPEDEQDLVEFMAKWGLLFSPFRNAKVHLPSWEDAEEVESSIAQTEILECALAIDCDNVSSTISQMIDTGEIDGNDEAQVSRIYECIGEPTAGRVVSFAEAASTLRIMQTVVEIIGRTARDGWANEDELYYVISVLNAGSCNSLTVQLSPECFYGLVQEADRGEAHRICLTSAICNQVIACLADEAPWRICSCEGCNRVFKRKQTDALSPNCDSKYCCDTCMERQKKRNQRRAAKSRIKH